MGRAPLSRTLVISLLAMTYGASAQQPSFRVSTSRVVVDVVATDARDRVVTDLTATDFDVLLNGRRQNILEFQRIDISSPRRNTALVDAQPFLDTATNARPGPRGRAFAFILDDPALDPADIVRFKRMMVEFLRGLSPDDQVAMTYVTRSDLSQDFSRDEARLVRAVNNINAAVGTGARADWRLVLKNVVNSIAAAREGRRAIIFVSNGRAFSPRDPELMDAIKQAQRLNVPIYAIDPRGLTAPELGLDGAIEDQTPDRRQNLDAAVQARQDGMRTLAELTGGRAFVKRWNVTQSVRDLLEDNSHYYLLAFEPAPAVEDGKFHSIDVRVRREGVHIRSRQGYMAPTTRAKPKATDHLVESLSGGLAGGELPLRATAAIVEPTPRGASVLVTAEVGSTGPNTAVQRSLRFVWIALDPDARIKASGQQTVKTHAGAVSLSHLIDIPVDRATLRIAVEEEGGGGPSGTIHLPVEAPASAGRWIGSIVIGAVPGPGLPAVWLGAGARPIAFEPSVDREFPSTQHIQVSARCSSTPSAIGSAALLLRQGEAVVRRAPLTSGTVDKRWLELRGAISLEGLESGRYALDVEVTGADGSVVRRSTAIVVK